MPRCEDYPCCGHTPGDPCPDRDREGRIVARCCRCDAKLGRSARSSLCARCQRFLARHDWEDPYGDHDHAMDY
jgi:hypothetical protein